MSQELTIFLANMATYSGLIPCLVAIFRIKSPVAEHRLLALLVWIGTGIGFMAFFMANMGLPNLYLLHFYTIINFILTTFLFRSIFPRKLMYTLLIAYVFFAVYHSVGVEQLQTMNVLNRSISAFIIMFYPLAFFVKTLQEMKIKRLEVLPLFWISVGTLFYNAGSFFIFLFSKDLEPFEGLWFSYFGLHAVFTIILYTFFTIALWVRPKR